MGTRTTTTWFCDCCGAETSAVMRIKIDNERSMSTYMKELCEDCRAKFNDAWQMAFGKRFV